MQPVIIKTEKNVYKFKIKYSTLCDLKVLGVDLMTDAGTKKLMEDPSQLRLVFWKGLESGEEKAYSKEQAFDIFDEIMEDLGPEEFSEIIPKSLAIKTKPKEEETETPTK